MGQTNKLKVGVHSYKPLVFQEKGRWSGLEVELWEKIAEELDIKYDYIEEKQFPSLLKKTTAGKFDLSMAGITRTIERDEKMDMSYFTLDTGLGIASLPRSSFSLRDLAKGLFSKQTIVLLLFLVLFAAITAHIYWFVESGFSVATKYSVGILESFWWSIVTFSTVGYGDIYPATFTGKIFGVLAILSGLALFGLYIGQLSASLALIKIKSDISSADDLAGKKVGVKTGTTAVGVVKSKFADVVEYPDLDDAYKALKKRQVDAVVADMPVLQNQMKEQGFVIPGPTFARQAYAYVFPKSSENSELIKNINRELIRIRESGIYDVTYKKYFLD